MFVSAYPSGSGETFIENELRYTNKFWEQISLVRNKTEDNTKRYVPSNCRLFDFSLSENNTSIKFYLRNFRIILYVVFLELIQSRQKLHFLKELKRNLGLLLASIRMAEQIKLLIDSTESNYFYSYWFNEWNLALSILRYRNTINRSHTRAHGFDLYEDNGKVNYLPYRYFCMKNTDAIFAVSDAGSDYLKERYPIFKKKIKRSYLGTKDTGMGPCNPTSKSVTVVSCGSLVDVKRPQLIIEILKKCTFDVLWVHIGDGHLRAGLEELSHHLPKNVSCQFLGKLGQPDLLRFYSENFIDCFLNTSISEGLPVSIMEAISFGIPVIATDVGGTSEIVKSGLTGHLVDVDFDPGKVASLIEGLRSQFGDRRGEIREFWSQYFNASNNYERFSQELLA